MRRKPRVERATQGTRTNGEAAMRRKPRLEGATQRARRHHQVWPARGCDLREVADRRAQLVAHRSRRTRVRGCAQFAQAGTMSDRAAMKRDMEKLEARKTKLEAEISKTKDRSEAKLAEAEEQTAAHCAAIPRNDDGSVGTIREHLDKIWFSAKAVIAPPRWPLGLGGAN